MTDYPSLFSTITAHPRYLANLDWGHPRPGHPEGSIRAHIADLEKNLETLRPRLSNTDIWKLKILIHTHDTFKPEALVGVPIAHENSHASLAKAFLAQFTPDPALLAIGQYHDEPYALYQQYKHKGAFNHDRFTALLTAIPDWNLFTAFLLIDNCTPGKSRDPLHWFFQQLPANISTSFTAADILSYDAS